MSGKLFQVPESQKLECHLQLFQGCVMHETPCCKGVPHGLRVTCASLCLHQVTSVWGC